RGHGPGALFDGLPLSILRQRSENGGQSSHQRCRQEKALPDQRGTRFQAVTGGDAARIWASNSKASVSANAGSAITSSMGPGRQPSARSSPPNRGPVILPIRPMPDAQPAPVPRNSMG